MHLQDGNSSAGSEPSAARIATTGPLILASASPRRAELLRRLGLDFETRTSGVDEASLPGEGPADHCRRLARAKAETVARQNPHAWVMGADTIVVIGDEILGKPGSPPEAMAMLGKLSGREHRVFTGFSLCRHDRGLSLTRAVESSVCFKEIPADEMAWYVRSGEPFDKAGAYAVQGRGAFFIREIRGSYTNVVGLPLTEVVEALKQAGVIAFAREAAP